MVEVGGQRGCVVVCVGDDAGGGSVFIGWAVASRSCSCNVSSCVRSCMFCTVVEVSSVCGSCVCGGGAGDCVVLLACVVGLEDAVWISVLGLGLVLLRRTLNVPIRPREILCSS